ncbi:hypothetical protein J6590_016395 [Homalodisca vitripennis]|nr:hypothetical protein J6590_016395 [Homalodisca vitripennis]
MAFTLGPKHLSPVAQCSGYGGYRKITRSRNVNAERSCPCKRPACPAIGGGSEVTFKPLVPRLSVIEGFLALTSPASDMYHSHRLDSWNLESTCVSRYPAKLTLKTFKTLSATQCNLDDEVFSCLISYIGLYVFVTIFSGSLQKERVVKILGLKSVTVLDVGRCTQRKERCYFPVLDRLKRKLIGKDQEPHARKCFSPAQRSTAHYSDYNGESEGARIRSSEATGHFVNSGGTFYLLDTLAELCRDSIVQCPDRGRRDIRAAGHCVASVMALSWPPPPTSPHNPHHTPLHVPSCPLNFAVVQTYLPLWPIARCSGYGCYRKITDSSNAERGCCLDG